MVLLVTYYLFQLVEAISTHLFNLIAEEGGSGKVALLEKGAYKGMDACLMYVQIQFVLINLRVAFHMQVSSCSWSHRISELEQLPRGTAIDSRVPGT